MDCVTFGIPDMVRLFQDLHRIWTSTPELAVPQQETLWAYVTVDETADRWAKCLFLIRA